MAVQKPIRILYQSKNNTTGLSDVKAQCYFNGVAKAVGASALSLTEVDSTNSPGLYELLIPAATLTTWGAAQGQTNTVEGYISSATAGAKAPFREEVTVANTDDIDVKLGTPAGASVSADIAAVQTKLGTPAGASVSADIAAVKSDTAAIKTDLETGSASLSTILSNIQALQNASIGNGVGFVLPTMLIPSTGSNTYVIPITINNNEGALIDPTSNLVTVGVKNSAGVDRGSFLTGSSGSPATVSATRTSIGEYTVTVVIPNTEVEEELIFSFAYTTGSSAMQRFGVAQTTFDDSGNALQSTLLATQTTVNAINTIVSSATYGNSAIQALLANPTYGLSALQGLLANGTYGLSAINTTVVANNAVLTNGTYGNSALQAQAAANATAIEGSGFVTGTDSLHQLSLAIAGISAASFVGGRAV